MAKSLGRGHPGTYHTPLESPSSGLSNEHFRSTNGQKLRKIDFPNSHVIANGQYLKIFLIFEVYNFRARELFNMISI